MAVRFASSRFPMARARASRPRMSATLMGWRQALIFAVLVAFTLQGYVFQTHIHFASERAAQPEFAAAAHGATGLPGTHHGKLPPSDDPDNCPLCQEILHSGQFVAPTATALVAPSAAVSTIAIVDAELPFVLALSHSWRGRAPPHS